MNTTTENQFKVGGIYAARSVGNWDCIFTITVLSRTPRMITIKDMGNVKTCRVKLVDGIESIYPARYSFAPTYYANKVA